VAGYAQTQPHPPVPKDWGALLLHDRQCVLSCTDDLYTCLDQAQQNLPSCVGPCADERAAAREACTSDPSSEACKQARGALRQCVGPCEEQYQSVVADCFTAGRGCVGDCPPAADIDCVRTCLAQRSDCYARVRDHARFCRGACTDELATAREQCGNDPAS